VGSKYGFKFEEPKTSEIRKMKNPELLPFVIACDNKIRNDKRFYFVTNKKLKKAMHVSNRDDFREIIFNRVERDHLFKKRITWEQVLENLKDLT
jgi:hypothetical protein